MDISVVIPLYNEEESLPELFAWIQRVMDGNHFSYEVIFVNDGSTDRSWEVIENLRTQSDKVKGIKFRRNYGKSPALYCGFEKAQGNVVITMDADLQDSPDEIPELYRMITKEGYDLVSGYKQKRYDPLSKTIPTKLFNATARAVSGINNLHDFNCGLKAYRRDVIKNIEVYGEMHRYIPYLAKNAGFSKIGEKIVHHQARKFGKTKFGGLNRFFQSQYRDAFLAQKRQIPGNRREFGQGMVLLFRRGVGEQQIYIQSHRVDFFVNSVILRYLGMDLAEVTQHVVTGGKLGALPRMEGKLVTYSLDVPVIQRNLVEQRLDNALYGEEIQTVAAIKAADQLVLFYRQFIFRSGNVFSRNFKQMSGSVAVVVVPL